MAETLVARSPLRPHVAPAAEPAAGPGVVLAERSGLTLANVSALRGREAELAEAVRASFGIELPATPRRVEGGDVGFVWAGPGRWLATSGAGTDFSSLPAAVCDQSDGRTTLTVSGPRARETLATLIAIDLHPRAFAPGDVAMSHAASIAVHLWQADDRPTYEIVCFRTYAATLWRWIAHAGASRDIAARPG